MMFKVLPYGQGGGYGPVVYLESLNPFGRGMRSSLPRVLKGDPAMMRLQIDAVPFTWKYSSAVFSFAKGDDPTAAQLVEIMDGLEDIAFAGLPLSSRSTLWILHEEDGRKELHILTPRQEVHTGKAFNPFPPGWEKKYDLLRDKFNYKYGWARPDDPRRARPVQPGTAALIDADCKRHGDPTPAKPKAAVTAQLVTLIEQGTIQSRADIIATLKAWEYELPRIGKDYVTILDPDTGTRTRLKGLLFAEDFSAEVFLAHQRAKEFLRDEPNMEKAAQADAALQAAIAKTAAYNVKRYKLPEIMVPAQPQQPATKSTVAEPSKEHQHGKYLQTPRVTASPVSGKRTGKGIAAAGRPRNHHALRQPRHEGIAAKRLPSTIAVRLRGKKKVQNLKGVWYKEFAKHHATQGDFGLESP